MGQYPTHCCVPADDWQPTGARTLLASHYGAFQACKRPHWEPWRAAAAAGGYLPLGGRPLDRCSRQLGAAPAEYGGGDSRLEIPIGVHAMARCARQLWYCGRVDRATAELALRRAPPGAFVVRRVDDDEEWGERPRLVMSVSAGGAAVAHYDIVRTAMGYTLQGGRKRLPSVESLVAHHSVLAEHLARPLALCSWHPLLWRRGGDNDCRALASRRQSDLRVSHLRPQRRRRDHYAPVW